VKITAIFRRSQGSSLVQFVLSILFVLSVSILVWTFFAEAAVIARWSDVDYRVRAAQVSDAERHDIQRIMWTGRRDWIVVRGLSGLSALITLAGIVWTTRNTRSDDTSKPSPRVH
jgi:hypothetical protein